MQLAQVRLRSGATVLTCWVPDRVRPGNWITLRDGEDEQRLWEVTHLDARLDSGQVHTGQPGITRR